MSEAAVEPEAGIAVGGQALVEGVMMRGPDQWAAAVRLADGEIDITDGPVPRWAPALRRLPVLRGVAALVETVQLGLRALRWSAARERGDPDDATTSRRLMAVTAITLIALVTIFAVVPAAAARAVGSTVDGRVAFAATEGLVRLGLFLAYVVAIGRSPAIRRTFQYHGAEHMMIAAYEHGEELTVERAKCYSTRHARCGTDFLLLVVVLAIVVFALLGDQSWPVLIATRVIGLALVAGLAYELLKLSRRRSDSLGVKIMIAPGLALQALTTREPTDDQLEVAAVALEAMLSMAADSTDERL